jgi:hypothetical protein
MQAILGTTPRFCPSNEQLVLIAAVLPDKFDTKMQNTPPLHYAGHAALFPIGPTGLRSSPDTFIMFLKCLLEGNKVIGQHRRAALVAAIGHAIEPAAAALVAGKLWRPTRIEEDHGSALIGTRP